VDDDKANPPNLLDALRDAARPTLETILDLAGRLWWFWLIVSAVLLVQLLAFIRQQRRLARSGILEIDTMDGPTFEQYLATMFRRLGYRVEVVGSARGDYGGDLVIRTNGIRTIVQAKRYRGKKVGIKAVQEAHTARAMYDCAEAMVVTNSVFSQQAQKTARKTDVRLWDRDELIKNLLKTQDAEFERLPDEVDVAFTAPNGLPAAVERSQTNCAKCGVEVSARVQAFCLANTQRFGGLVYCFPHQRGFRRPPASSLSA